MAEYDDLQDDEDDLEDQPQQQQQPQTVDRKHIRALEKKAKSADDAEARAVAAERRLAAIESGIDLTSPTGRLFMDAYKGEATVDAITAAAIGYGIKEDPSAVPAEEVAAQQRVTNASKGSEAAPPVNLLDTLDPTKLTEDQFWAEATKAGRVAT